MKINKTVRIGTVEIGGRPADVFCRVKFEGGKLSISGVEGPLRNGDARGSCGQIEMHMGNGDGVKPAPGWTPALIQKFLETWRAWHLNDMRAGCEHQRAKGWGSENLEIMEFGINSKAWELKHAAEEEMVKAAQEGRADSLTPAQVFLVGPDWADKRYTLPADGSPLAGLYELKETKQELSGWAYESEHPRGVLMKPCPDCGYKYGSAWLKEEVPASVLEFLAGLPDSDKVPAWV